ncbi:hypothetical protein D3C77_647020 [compost metagenome]
MQLLHDRLTHLIELQCFCFKVLLDPHDNRGVRVKLDYRAVRAVDQYLVAERSLNDLPVGSDTFSTFTRKRWRGLYSKAQFLRWLRQVRSFECRIFQLLARLDESLLDLLRLELPHQLRLHAVETRNLRRLDAE